MLCTLNLSEASQIWSSSTRIEHAFSRPLFIKKTNTFNLRRTEILSTFNKLRRTVFKFPSSKLNSTKKTKSTCFWSLNLTASMRKIAGILRDRSQTLKWRFLTEIKPLRSIWLSRSNSKIWSKSSTSRSAHTKSRLNKRDLNFAKSIQNGKSNLILPFKSLTLRLRVWCRAITRRNKCCSVSKANSTRAS